MYENKISPSRIGWGRRNPRGLVAKVLDCDNVVSEFELQLRYYVHFQIHTLGKYMNPLILSAMGQIGSLMFFCEDRFGIK